MSNFYDRVNWKDYPETDTPITAENLNKMDAGIYDISTDIGDMDLIADSADGTICTNLSNALGIKVYVGTDKKLHFVDGTGADSVLPFSQNWKMVLRVSVAAYVTYVMANAPGTASGTTDTHANATITVTCTNGSVSISGGSGQSGVGGWYDCTYAYKQWATYSVSLVSFEWL